LVYIDQPLVYIDQPLVYIDQPLVYIDQHLVYIDQHLVSYKPFFGNAEKRHVLEWTAAATADQMSREINTAPLEDIFGGETNACKAFSRCKHPVQPFFCGFPIADNGIGILKYPCLYNTAKDFINQVLVHINLHRLRANHQQVYINHPRVSWFRLSERTHKPAQPSANAFFPESAMGATGNGQAGCARASQNGSLLPPAAAAVLHPPHCRRNVDW
jgi:hypothetical protein